MSNDADQVDPKEAMREALERKKAQQHAHADGPDSPASKVKGGAHGPQGAKRVFRRKSGG